MARQTTGRAASHEYEAQRLPSHPPIADDPRQELARIYPVLQRVVGDTFFGSAVDAFADQAATAVEPGIRAGTFADFLARYSCAIGSPQLTGLARLEWAIDEVRRADDDRASPERLLQALGLIPAGALPSVTTRLSAACRLVSSAFPVLDIWRVNQPGFAGDRTVDLARGVDRLLVHRGPRGIAIARLDLGSFVWLRQLGSGGTLGRALTVATTEDRRFDAAAALRTHIAAGTIVAIVVPLA